MFRFLPIFHLFLISFAEDLPPKNYGFEFPDFPNKAAAILKDVTLPDDVEEFSLSLWAIRQDDVYISTPFLSYAVGKFPVGKRPAGFSFEASVYFAWVVNNEFFKSSKKIELSKWAHYVTMIRLKDGLIKLYINGEEAYTNTTTTFANKRFKGNGTLVLGQIQGEVGIGFDMIRCFHNGGITSFNLWDKLLNANEVEQAYKSNLEGNIVAWSKTVWATSGEINIVGTERIKEITKYADDSMSCRQPSASLKIRFYQLLK